METERCDAVIAGARLAGSCAAAHLARAGRKVVVLDRMSFPSDQLSTHLLFPAGIDELRRMGALEGILACDPMPSPYVSLSAPDGVVVRERWRAVGDINYSLCVPRTMQDEQLVLAARAAGADVRERCEVIGVTWRGGRASGLRYRDEDGAEHVVSADLVVGADGRRSTVAAELGVFKPYRGSLNGRGLVFRYLDDPLAGTPDGETIWQWREGNSLGFAFPSAPRGRILALFMGPADEAAWARRDIDGYWDAKMAEHPQMRHRLAGGTNLSRPRSTGDTSSYFRASSGPGWALLGDAGHFKDPVIGQGQRDALWSGRVLAERVADRLGDPAAVDVALRCWEQERDLECLPAYHFGNIETRVQDVSPVLIEVLRRAAGTEAESYVSDLFGRSRTMPQILTLGRLGRGLVDAVARRGPDTSLISEAVEDLKVHLRVRREMRGKAFRSQRTVSGSEHPDGRSPIVPNAVLARQAATSAATEAAATEAAATEAATPARPDSPPGAQTLHPVSA